MRRFSLFILTAVMCGSAIVAVGDTQGRNAVRVSSRPSKLLVPILDLRYAALADKREGHGTPFWKMGELLGRLYRDRSPAADEASVILLRYYLGEANGHDLLENVISRGKRVLPFLVKYQNKKAIVPGRETKYLKIPLTPVREDNYSIAIHDIQSGKVLPEED